MKKRIRRNIVFLLIFAILFANLGLAGSASASEKDPVKEAQAQETEDIAKDAENAGMKRLAPVLVRKYSNIPVTDSSLIHL